MLQLGHIEIFVSDPLRAHEFYTRVLGFECTEIQHDSFVWLTSGGVTLLLRPKRVAPHPDSYQEAGCALVLYADNFEQTKADLIERGVTFRGTDGSDLCATFTDPDGNWFQLVNPHEH